MFTARYRLSPYITQIRFVFNPLNPKLNPICYLLALLGVHHFLHVSRIRVKSLTLRLLMSYIYIYMENLFLMFLDHTKQRTTVGRTPLDEWSARCRDLYLTTHNRQISMPPVGFKPTISAGERPCGNLITATFAFMLYSAQSSYVYSAQCLAMCTVRSV